MAALGIKTGTLVSDQTFSSSLPAAIQIGGCVLGIAFPGLDNSCSLSRRMVYA